MGQALFDRRSGRFVAWSRWDALTHDPAARVLVELDEHPAPGARWDGVEPPVAGVRAATPAEAAAEAEAEAARRIETALREPALDRLVKVLARRLGLADAAALIDEIKTEP